jgi:dGTPase
VEAQITNIADEITYNTHDIDDGVSAGILNLDELAELDIWDEAIREVADKAGHADATRQRYQIIRALINQQITDVIQTTHENLVQHGLQAVEDVRNLGCNVVDYSTGLVGKNNQLRAYLMDNFYRQYRVMRMSRKAARFIGDMFNEYREDPRQLPPPVQRDMETMPLERAICDYIAGMTDRYALDEHKRLFDPYEKV